MTSFDLTYLDRAPTEGLMRDAYSLTHRIHVGEGRGKAKAPMTEAEVQALRDQRALIEAEIIRRADTVPAQAGELLRDARGSKSADRGLAISWGRKRKDLLDHLIDRGLLR